RRGACAIRSAANRGTTTPATSAARQKARDGGNWVHRLLSKFGRVITVCIISDRFRRSPVTSPETEANQGRCHRQTGASLECVAEPPGQKGVVPLFLQWRSRKRGMTPFCNRCIRVFVFSRGRSRAPSTGGADPLVQLAPRVKQRGIEGLNRRECRNPAGAMPRRNRAGKPDERWKQHRRKPSGR